MSRDEKAEKNYFINLFYVVLIWKVPLDQWSDVSYTTDNEDIQQSKVLVHI